MQKQYSFYFESDKCLNCLSCEIACQQWKGIKAGTIKLRKVIEVSKGTFPEVTRKFLSLSCRHCAKAPCVATCPADAISKRDDGIVLVDSQKCIGCRSCLESCPFGIPQYDEQGLMQKCDMCLDRLSDGQKPICVEACPTRALHWGTLEDLSEIAFQKATSKSASAVSLDRNTDS
jgi:DMSO reductase iron-sulfur subunit